MSRKRNKLEISGQFLQCPLLLSIDTYEGCSNECRYCFVNLQHDRQYRGNHRRQCIRPALLTAWERVLNGESINNPMIEYLVRKKHPIQLGTKAEPFPKDIEQEVQNTRKFLEMCNKVNYPVYISTKNTGNMPFDLLAKGNYVLGVSLSSHRTKDIRMLEKYTSNPMVRLKKIPAGVFKKVIVRWQPFIPQLFKPRKKYDEIINFSAVERYLDKISGIADGVSISFLNRSIVKDQALLKKIGPDDLGELDEIEILNYIREQAYLRGLEFYTANYRALSDSPICCGLREDEFKMYTPWVWSFLIRKLFTGEKKYLTVKDLARKFPKALKGVKFATTKVALFSRWARYSATKTTILEEYIKNFTFNRKMNPANFFAGLYSKVVNGQFRIYFLDYRRMVS
jgi:DNA repair photolyase